MRNFSTITKREKETGAAALVAALLIAIVSVAGPGISQSIQQPAHVLGTFATNDCPKINASGFIVSNGAACGGTSFFGATLAAVVPGNWSALGTGGSITTVDGVAGTSGAIKIVGIPGTGTNGNWAGAQVTVAGTTWTKTLVLYSEFNTNTNGVSTGFIVGPTDGTKVEGILWGTNTTGAYASGGVSITNVTGGTIAGISSQLAGPGAGPVFIRVSRATNTYTVSISADGINFDTSFTESVPFLTATGIAVVGSARGGTNAPTCYLESFN